MGEPITGSVNEAVRRVSMGNSLVVIIEEWYRIGHNPPRGAVNPSLDAKFAIHGE
ncbi:hypothetical protein HORIV_34130 [Vreelandella olivaria]|uniref:Uncharacterized protein n=1 Tax=Vreelandella olivaria TaxID=390919 RepID=A0ABN5WYM6_9GAMM|nr:hypothetical protein HORIV_34130 [Halomonas olivaria]